MVRIHPPLLVFKKLAVKLGSVTTPVAKILCAIALTISVNSHGTEKPTKLNIYTEEFPPYNYMKNGKIRGINAKLTRQICEHAGIACNLELFPWNRSFAMTQRDPRGGLISTSRHPDREKLFKWVGPLESANDRACFYKLRRRIDIPMLLNKKTLKQYSFPIVRNDIYAKVLKGWGLTPEKHFVLFSNKHQGTKEFATGKLDLLIASPFTLSTLLPDVGLTIDNVYPVMNLYDETFGGNFLALNLAVPDVIVNKLQNSLDAIPKQDRETLMRTYLNVPKRKFPVEFKTQNCL